MRGFVLLTLQKYGEHTRSELEADCKSVSSREVFEEPESLDQALKGLVAGGMVRSEWIEGVETFFPVYSREKKKEIEASKQAALFE